MEAASVSGKGLYVHSGLVIRLDGIPLGTLERRTSCCQTQEKESQRRINTLAGCYDHIPENIETIVVADREAAMYDLFVAERHSKLHLLVRAVQDRPMDHTALYLQKAVSDQVPVGEVQVEVGRRGELVPRQAVLAIRYLQVQCHPIAGFVAKARHHFLYGQFWLPNSRLRQEKKPVVGGRLDWNGHLRCIPLSPGACYGIPTRHAFPNHKVAPSFLKPMNGNLFAVSC